MTEFTKNLALLRSSTLGGKNISEAMRPLFTINEKKMSLFDQFCRDVDDIPGIGYCFHTSLAFAYCMGKAGYGDDFELIAANIESSRSKNGVADHFHVIVKVSPAGQKPYILDLAQFHADNEAYFYCQKEYWECFKPIEVLRISGADLAKRFALNGIKDLNWARRQLLKPLIQDSMVNLSGVLTEKGRETFKYG